MAVDVTPAGIAALRGSYAPTRKPDRRTEAAELRLELRVRSAEEAVYVARTRDGFDRIVRCLHGGLVNEAYDLAAAGLTLAQRRGRQLRGPSDAA